MNRTEAIVISAAVALAMLPRFEAKIEQYAKAHRTEIQMAMNELQGKPAVPFAVPELSTGAAPRFELASYEQAFDERQMDAEMEKARVEAAEIRPVINVATRVQLAQVKAQAASLRAMAAQQRALVAVYRVRAPKCPMAPGAPAIPERFSEDSGS